MSKLNISRRDFMNGIALGTIAGYSLSPAEAFAAMDTSAAYPPGLTGLRGAHPGSFEVAHAVSWGGTKFARPKQQTDSDYDLVIVGGGLSGLAAASRYRKDVGAEPKILILDNHDDFGGHAKRNEFTVDGRKLIGYGGSQSIDSPASYSAGARQVLVDAGIDVERFYTYFDRKFYSDRGLSRGIYFSEQMYGEDKTVAALSRWRGRGAASSESAEETVNNYPLSEASRASLLQLLNTKKDFLQGDSRASKIDRLRRMSCRDYLLDIVGVPEEVYLMYRDSTRGIWGVGYDALSALEGYRMGAPPNRKVAEYMIAVDRAYIEKGSLSIFPAAFEAFEAHPVGGIQVGLWKAIRAWYGTDSRRLEGFIIAIQIPVLALLALASFRAFQFGGEPLRLAILLLVVVGYFWLVLVVVELIMTIDLLAEVAVALLGEKVDH